MNSDLLNNNFLIVKNFIDSDRAINLYKEFKLCDQFYEFNGDDQAPNSASVYNYLPSLELLCEKTKHVSDLIGESVLPTYTYSRIYKENSILTKHTDRGSCEISLTVHLYGDKPWPIWIETPEKKPRCVILNPGDALLYLGCVAPHWRDEYVGKEYAQFFLHYVRSRGACSKLYFDKFKQNQNLSKLIQEYKSMGWLNKEKISQGDVDLNDESPKYKFSNKNRQDRTEYIVEKDPDFIVFGDNDSPFLLNKNYEQIDTKVDKKISNKTLKDYIKVFDNAAPSDLCDDILKEYVDTDLWKKTLTGSGHNPNARNCNVIPISEQVVIFENSEVRSEIDQKLYEVVSNSLNLYEKSCPEIELEIKQDSGYELLRYKEGEFYVEHTDSFKEIPRAVSCIISLNDDYIGGEVSFFSRELSYKLKKGSVLMFPSNFMYPHEIQKVISGTRYSIITWLV